MIKPQHLMKGDKVAIVCLSRGLLGEPFCKHELDLGIERLKKMGLEPVIMPNALKGMDYLENHPEARAEDLKNAFYDSEIKAIITAIGGNDTYKLIPYLMEDEKFKEAVRKHPKIFSGFSDTTNNHFLFSHLGLETFYGPCFLVDIAELDTEMLPYTKEYFEKYFKSEHSFEIKSSPIWYCDRESYGIDQLGIPREERKEQHGFEKLNGSGVVSGYLYGGCIESFYDALEELEASKLYAKYHIFPTLEEYQEKILFLETSDEKPSKENFETMLLELKNRGILKQVKGVLFGKPIDEVYYDEYKEVIKKIFSDLDTPVLYNVNFGHAVPRCILPYGAKTIIDYDKKTITIAEQILEER